MDGWGEFPAATVGMTGQDMAVIAVIWGLGGALFAVDRWRARRRRAEQAREVPEESRTDQ